MRGRTGICILDGMMDGESYVSILRQTLLPFLCEVYPDEQTGVSLSRPVLSRGCV